MDGRTFDALARHLVGTKPRRHVLAALASVLAIGLAPPERALACKKVNKKCDKTKDCCDGAKCKKDKCKCKSGRQECGGKCYQLDRDKQHCGSCNTRCLDNDFCQDGRCVNVPS